MISGSSQGADRLLSQRAMYGLDYPGTPMNSQNRQTAFHSLPPAMCPVSSDSLCSNHMLGYDSENFQINFIPSQPVPLLAYTSPQQTRLPGHPGFTLHTVTSFHRPGFHHYYGIICHLTPLRQALDSSLYLPIPTCGNDIRLPRLRRTPCKQSHPQSRYGTDQVPGFTLFRTLTLPHRRIRFAYAMDRSLPIASFRPRRCQQRPCDSDCLPPGRGDACLPQAGFARHAGQTKKGGRRHASHPF